MKRSKPKPKKPKANSPGAPTAEHIAAIAQVSIQLVYKKLRQGRSPAQIVAEAQTRRERQQELLAGLPSSGPVNGGANGFPFSFWQTKKEAALAGLREAELAEKTATMIETATMRRWLNHWLRPVVDALRNLPGQMSNEVGGETGKRLEKVLEGKIENILQGLVAYLDECSRTGCAPAQDGNVRSGDYQVTWAITPVPPEFS
jgi:hypothetical protein